jgi:threonine/homoserine/homoserine lactone efflux protein
MNDAVIIGLLTAFGMAISTGPVFLTIIQSSIAKGFRTTVFFILGVSIADTSILSLCWYGLEKLDMGLDPALIKLVAGFGLMAFGSTYLFKQSISVKKEGLASVLTPNKKEWFSRGVLIDLVNPIVWAFWIGISQFSITKFSNAFDQSLYFVSILLTILATDMIKAYFAAKLGSYFTSTLLKWFNRGIGILLIGLGIKFIVDHFI